MTSKVSQRLKFKLSCFKGFNHNSSTTCLLLAGLFTPVRLQVDGHEARVQGETGRMAAGDPDKF